MKTVYAKIIMHGLKMHVDNAQLIHMQVVINQLVYVRTIEKYLILKLLDVMYVLKIHYLINLKLHAIVYQDIRKIHKDNAQELSTVHLILHLMHKETVSVMIDIILMAKSVNVDLFVHLVLIGIKINLNVSVPKLAII